MKIKIIQTTIDYIELAESISEILVTGNISPCVQIISNVKSVYQWKNKVETSNEILLLIKTIPENVQKCKDIILEYHKYDTPELIVIDGHIIDDNYQTWFMDHTRKL